MMTISPGTAYRKHLARQIIIQQGLTKDSCFCHFASILLEAVTERSISQPGYLNIRIVSRQNISGNTMTFNTSKRGFILVLIALCLTVVGAPVLADETAGPITDPDTGLFAISPMFSSGSPVQMTLFPVTPGESPGSCYRHGPIENVRICRYNYSIQAILCISQKNGLSFVQHADRKFQGKSPPVTFTTWWKLPTLLPRGILGP